MALSPLPFLESAGISDPSLALTGGGVPTGTGAAAARLDCAGASIPTCEGLEFSDEMDGEGCCGSLPNFGGGYAMPGGMWPGQAPSMNAGCCPMSPYGGGANPLTGLLQGLGSLLTGLLGLGMLGGLAGLAGALGMLQHHGHGHHHGHHHHHQHGQGAPSGGAPVGPGTPAEASFTNPGGTIQGSYQARGTGYYPANNAMEGGFTDERGHRLYTLQDYLSGHAPYVSVAMDSQAGIPYGTNLRIPQLEHKYGRPIDFRVVDTGGAFQGKGTSRIDICTASNQASLDPTINGPLTLMFP